jgi:DNA-binding response OmpR family regulator
MQILIVESNPDLAEVWKRHLERLRFEVSVAGSQSQAIALLRGDAPSVIVLNLFLDEGSAIAVADFASYRHPAAKVVFVTRSSFFSDGSIFNLVPNACGFFPERTPPEDLAEIVAHFGG